VKTSYSLFLRDIAVTLSSLTVLTVPEKDGTMFKAMWICFPKSRSPRDGSAVHCGDCPREAGYYNMAHLDMSSYPTVVMG